MLLILLSLLATYLARSSDDHHIVSFKSDVSHEDQLNHIDKIHSKSQEARKEDGTSYHGVKAHYKHFSMYYIQAHKDLIEHIRGLQEIHFVEPQGYASIARTSTIAMDYRTQCKDEAFLPLFDAPQELILRVALPSAIDMIHDDDAPANLGRISHKHWQDWNNHKHEYVYSPDVVDYPVVYLIDTGAQVGHVEFEDRVVSGRACEHCVNNNDEDNHGTHVLATIIGKTVGIARDITAVSLKVIDRSGLASISAIIEALDFVLTDIGPNNLKVVNMSLNTLYYSVGLNLAVNKAVEKGLHIVTSAGNNGASDDSSSPASAAYALTVGSIDAEDTRAESSNWNEFIDFVAPGVDVYSASAGYVRDAYMTLSGTSMATPHVSGVICYMLGLYGPMSPAEVKAKLHEWSTEVPKGFGKDTKARILYNGSGF